MSYDLAVWEGDPPADGHAATATFIAMYDQYINVGPGERSSLSPRLRTFIEALRDRWPDITDDPQGSPWAAGPLIREARGPFMYFAIALGREASVGGYAAQLALEHGLV